MMQKHACFHLNIEATWITRIFGVFWKGELVISDQEDHLPIMRVDNGITEQTAHTAI